MWYLLFSSTKLKAPFYIDVLLRAQVERPRNTEESHRPFDMQKIQNSKNDTAWKDIIPSCRLTNNHILSLTRKVLSREYKEYYFSPLIEMCQNGIFDGCLSPAMIAFLKEGLVPRGCALHHMIPLACEGENAWYNYVLMPRPLHIIFHQLLGDSNLLSGNKQLDEVLRSKTCLLRTPILNNAIFCIEQLCEYFDKEAVMAAYDCLDEKSKNLLQVYRTFLEPNCLNNISQITRPHSRVWNIFQRHFYIVCSRNDMITKFLPMIQSSSGKVRSCEMVKLIMRQMFTQKITELSDLIIDFWRLAYDFECNFNNLRVLSLKQNIESDFNVLKGNILQYHSDLIFRKKRKRKLRKLLEGLYRFFKGSASATPLQSNDKFHSVYRAILREVEQKKDSFRMLGTSDKEKQSLILFAYCVCWGVQNASIKKIPSIIIELTNVISNLNRAQTRKWGVRMLDAISRGNIKKIEELYEQRGISIDKTSKNISNNCSDWYVNLCCELSVIQNINIPQAEFFSYPLKRFETKVSQLNYLHDWYEINKSYCMIEEKQTIDSFLEHATELVHCVNERLEAFDVVNNGLINDAVINVTPYSELMESSVSVIKTGYCKINCEPAYQLLIRDKENMMWVDTIRKRLQEKAGNCNSTKVPVLGAHGVVLNNIFNKLVNKTKDEIQSDVFGLIDTALQLHESGVVQCGINLDAITNTEGKQIMNLNISDERQKLLLGKILQRTYSYYRI